MIIEEENRNRNMRNGISKNLKMKNSVALNDHWRIIEKSNFEKIKDEKLRSRKS